MTGTDETPDRVSQAFAEYVAAFRSGQGDPSPYLNRFEGRERQELDVLIEAFIATGPLSSPDPSDPSFDAMVGRVMGQLDGQAGRLSVLLAQLRASAKMTQAAVVGALSEALRANPAETKKIDAYYHRLEWGSLPAEGITSKLYGMLGKILEADPQDLRKAAREMGPRSGPSAGPVFARTVESVERNEDASVAPGQELPGKASGEAEPQAVPDRIDELFTGG